ncbi:hypothetical protein Lser_V15G05127 [Lactuca serriola]
MLPMMRSWSSGDTFNVIARRLRLEITIRKEISVSRTPQGGPGEHCNDQDSFGERMSICEDIPQVLDAENPGSSERPIDVFLPRLLQVLYMSMDSYLQGLFVLANDPSLEVRKLMGFY